MRIWRLFLFSYTCFCTYRAYVLIYVSLTFSFRILRLSYSDSVIRWWTIFVSFEQGFRSFIWNISSSCITALNQWSTWIMFIRHWLLIEIPMVDSWKFKLSDLLLAKLSFEVKACLVCLFVVEISKKKVFRNTSGRWFKIYIIILSSLFASVWCWQADILILKKFSCSIMINHKISIRNF